MQDSLSPAHLVQRPSEALSALCSAYPQLASGNNGSFAAWCQLAAACCSPEAADALQACSSFGYTCLQHVPSLSAQAVADPVIRAAVEVAGVQPHSPAAAELLAQHVTPANLQQLQQALDDLQAAANTLRPGDRPTQSLSLPSSQLLALMLASRLFAAPEADQTEAQQQLPGTLQSLEINKLELLARWAVLGGPRPELPGQDSAALSSSLAVQLAHAEVCGIHDIVLSALWHV